MVWPWDPEANVFMPTQAWAWHRAGWYAQPTLPGFHLGLIVLVFCSIPLRLGEEGKWGTDWFPGLHPGLLLFDRFAVGFLFVGREAV